MRNKQTTALAEEDYELAEELNQQLDATGMEPEHNTVSVGLMEVL